ncbi:hypothetical protein Ccrd_010329, partial [Cynara cardunculus var. scolymus]
GVLLVVFLSHTESRIHSKGNPNDKCPPKSKKQTLSRAMYGGDEVSAIVVDLGSHTCKAGYAGEDAPKAVFPSVIGSIDQMEVDENDNPEKNTGAVTESKSKGKRKLYVGSSAMGYRRDHMEVIPSIKDGIVTDWDIVESIWDHTFSLGILLFSTPILPQQFVYFSISCSPIAKVKRNVCWLILKSIRCYWQNHHLTLNNREKSRQLQYALGAVIPFVGIFTHYFLMLEKGKPYKVDGKDLVPRGCQLCQSTLSSQKRTAEIMFEKYQAPALFLAKNAVLTSFASGRATSLVVDSGGGSTTVAPVHDGYVLQKVKQSHFKKCMTYEEENGRASEVYKEAKQAVTASKDKPYEKMYKRLDARGGENGIYKAVSVSPIGGEFLTDCLIKSLESKGVKIRPRYSFKRKEVRPGEFQTVDVDFPNTTESYRMYCQRVIASDIKECVCRAPDTPYDDISYSNIPMTAYELPDGQTIEIGSDRFKTPDILFNPSLVKATLTMNVDVPYVRNNLLDTIRSPVLELIHQRAVHTIPGMEGSLDIASSARGLPQMVIESINKCDVDIRRELFSSILLAGGTASMQQLKERLEKDLLEESPQAARVKVLASGNSTERRFSVWIGGSILASLGSFQQMWFSKSEYEEHGSSYIQRKCP